MAIKSVRCKINNVWTTLNLQSDGTYKANLTAPSITSYNINAGHYYPITVEATNMADTATTVDDTDATLGQSLRLVVKEVTAPTITISSPTAGQYLAIAAPTIAFTCVDGTNGSGVSISTLQIILDGTTYTNTSTGVTVTTIANGYSVSFVPAVLSDGSHTLSVKVTDNDGNQATSSTVLFKTDTVAPTLAITNPATNGTYAANASLNITGTTSDATSGTPIINIKLNNVSQGNVTVSGGAFSKTVTLINGSNTIVVTATDLAGKVTTITRTIILDTSSPVVASVDITPNPVNVGGSYSVTISVNG